MSMACIESRVSTICEHLSAHGTYLCKIWKQCITSMDNSTPHFSFLIGVSLGSFISGEAKAIAKPASDTPCSDLTKASNGIEWCDTKEGNGSSPNKGDLIRYFFSWVFIMFELHLVSIMSDILKFDFSILTIPSHPDDKNSNPKS